MRTVRRNAVWAVGVAVAVVFGSFGCGVRDAEQEVPQSKQLVLQQGVDGYEGSAATCISGPQPGKNFAASEALPNRELRRADSRVLLRFDVSAIPSDARIVFARLGLCIQHMKTDEDGEQQFLFVHEVLKPWVLGEVTADERAKGKPWGKPNCEQLDEDRTNDWVARLEVPTGEPERWATVDLTEAVQHWVDGSRPNHGLILINARRWDDIGWHSARAAETSKRPRLTVAYVEKPASPPCGPARLSARPGKAAADLSWQAGRASEDPTVVGYRLYRLPTDAAAEPQLVAQLGAREFSCADRGLANGQRYRYRLVSVDHWGRESTVRREADVTPSADASPLPVVGLSGERTGPRVALKWKPSAETPAVGYHVYADGRRVTDKPVSAAGAWLDGRRAGESYTVRAVDAEGRESVDSAPVEPVEVPCVMRPLHPRMLLTRDMLGELRERCRTDYAADYERMVQWADGQAALVMSDEWAAKEKLSFQEARGLQTMGLLWQLTGDRRYAEAGIRLLKAWMDGRATGYLPNRYLGDVSVMYDLLCDGMSREERRELGNRILHGVWGPRGYALGSFFFIFRCRGLLALYGDGIDDEGAAKLWAGEVEYMREKFLPDHRFISKGRGAWLDSMHCGCFEEYHVPFFWFVLNATGRNLFRSEMALRGMGVWYVYNIFDFGPSRDRSIGANVVPVSSIYHGGVRGRGCFGTPICAAASGDGVTAWLVRQQWWQKSRGIDLVNPKPWDIWYKIVFLDPKAPLIEPDRLPEATLFEGIGWVSMRGSWKPDGTFLHFKCGFWEGGEPAHLDNNAFYIYKKGPLAIDGIKPRTEDVKGGVPYGRMTIAHNTVTVYDPDEKIMGAGQYTWSGAGKAFPVNDGGQTFRRERRVEGAIRNPRVRQGHIAAYQTHRLFDYVCGDATDSYNPKKLKQFTRQIVFVRPDCFVIFDRVVSTKPEFPKHWLLHSYGEPQIAGNLVTIDAPEEKPTPGRLFSRTLLPRAVKVEKYHRGTLVRGGKDLTPEIWNTTEESWRIEVEPQEKRTDDVFLHVLFACDRTVEQTVASELVERGGLVGAKLTVAGRTWEVMFNRTGAVGGHVKASDGVEAVLDLDLAEGIEDNYEGWKDDPRYREWTASPDVRAVVLPHKGAEK